jgi:hypothetical protein
MDRVSWSRLRWRLRGAWEWPAFFVAVAAEAVLLNVLPVAGDGPRDVFAAVLLAGCLNVIILAVLAPLGGRLLRLRRRDLPRPIAADYVGAGLIGVLLAALVVAGLVHRPERMHERAARAAQWQAVSLYVTHNMPAYASRLGEADTIRIETDEYRTCLPSDDPNRAVCMFVNTDQDPPGITRSDGTPNALYRLGGFR